MSRFIVKEIKACYNDDVDTEIKLGFILETAESRPKEIKTSWKYIRDTLKDNNLDRIIIGTYDLDTESHLLTKCIDSYNCYKLLDSMKVKYLLPNPEDFRNAFGLSPLFRLKERQSKAFASKEETFNIIDVSIDNEGLLYIEGYGPNCETTTLTLNELKDKLSNSKDDVSYVFYQNKMLGEKFRFSIADIVASNVPLFEMQA